MIYTMSDIHGRKDRFDDIMNQINLHDEDTLYILGDVVDRNPDGIDILEYIMDKPNIKMLLGNHEHMMIESLVDRKGAWLWHYNGGDVTQEKWEKRDPETRERILDYIKNLPLIYELNVNGTIFRLVHGKSPTKKQISCCGIENLKKEIVWDRVRPSDSGAEDLIVIFGHTPTSYYQQGNPLKIWHGDNLIGIDCGAAFSKGRLACLRLNDMQEFYSTC